MTGAYAQVAGKANSGRDNIVVVSRQPCRWILAVVAAAQALWPSEKCKTPAELAACARADKRTAERWIATHNGMSADALVNLLQSEHGLQFLEALMGDARPDWWRRVRRSARLSLLRRQQEEQRRLIEQLELELAE